MKGAKFLLFIYTHGNLQAPTMVGRERTLREKKEIEIGS